MIFTTFQTDTGLASAFRWEFPNASPQDTKLRTAKAAWAASTELARVPKVLFEMALRRIGSEYQAGRANKSLPSVGDFLVLCRPKPEALGMPSANDAWGEASRHAMSARHRWAHPAVKIAMVATGAHDIRNADSFQARELRQRFDRYYEQLVLQVAQGEDLSAPRMLLGSDDNKPQALLQEEHAERQMQARLEQQGLAGTGADARRQLLAGLGIKREVANG